MQNIEGQTYSLNNKYLSEKEKEEVELWFQLPGSIMIISFFITSVLFVIYNFPWFYVFVIPLALNIISAILNWYFYNKKINYLFYFTILHSWVIYLLGFGSAIFLFYKHSYILAILSLIAPFGILSFLEPSTFLHLILAYKKHVHPKYVFFKRIYGRTFPFEEKSE